MRADQKAEQELEEKLLNKKISLEKRIDAIKEIAIAYLSNQPQILIHR